MFTDNLFGKITQMTSLGYYHDKSQFLPVHIVKFNLVRYNTKTQQTEKLLCIAVHDRAKAISAHFKIGDQVHGLAIPSVYRSSNGNSVHYMKVFSLGHAYARARR